MQYSLIIVVQDFCPLRITITRGFPAVNSVLKSVK